jgi:hypothetical protein
MNNVLEKIDKIESELKELKTLVYNNAPKLGKKIYEIAKDHNVDTIKLTQVLQEKGFPYKNHMATVTYEDVQKVLRVIEVYRNNLSRAPKTIKSTLDQQIFESKLGSGKTTYSPYFIDPFDDETWENIYNAWEK